MDWLTDWLIDLIDWSIDWLTDWLLERLIDWLRYWFGFLFISTDWWNDYWFSLWLFIVVGNILVINEWHMDRIDWLTDWLTDWLIDTITLVCKLSLSFLTMITSGAAFIIESFDTIKQKQPTLEVLWTYHHYAIWHYYMRMNFINFDSYYICGINNHCLFRCSFIIIVSFITLVWNLSSLCHIWHCYIWNYHHCVIGCGIYHHCVFLTLSYLV